MSQRILISVFAVTLPAVAAAEVRVDLDRHKDFGKYRTVSVEVGPLVRTDGEIDTHNTLAESRLERAIVHEFLGRGIESTESGSDLIVRVTGRDTQRSEIVRTGWNSYPGYWHRRWGYWRYPYARWGGVYDDVWTRRYLEGSLTFDVIERATGELIYRAQVTEEVGSDREKQMTKTVDKALKKFPIKELSD